MSARRRSFGDGVLIALALVLTSVNAAGAAIVEAKAEKRQVPVATIWHTATCPPGFNAYAKVKVTGLKDQRGMLRVELYPDTKEDFVVNMLARVQVPTPAGDPTICIALPKPGRYAIAVHHDRNDDNRFDLFIDGFGFSNNPHIGFSLPKVDKVAFDAKPGFTELTVNINYVFGHAPKHQNGPHG
jgi:uncharacterized protein (DUF2141 family)